MSLESAVGFYERLAAEPDLQERIRELETPDRIESYVKGELGYDFTREEMQRVIFERHPEMTDEELEAVTGGEFNGWNVAGIVIVLGCALLSATASAVAAA